MATENSDRRGARFGGATLFSVMLGRIAGGLAASVAAVIALALPAPAAALSCGGSDLAEPADPVEDADVVFDGIVLSGVNSLGAADSPARVLVTRYVKGGGARVRRVRTAVEVRPLFVRSVAGDFSPDIGDAVRVYGSHRPPVRGFRLPPGTLFAGACEGSYSTPGARLLDHVDGTSRRAAASTGTRPWVASAQRGPHGLRCLRARRRARRGLVSDLADCRILRAGSALVTVGGSPFVENETAVAAWAPGLQRVEVSAPGQPTRILAGPAALTVLPARYADYEVRLRLTFADGNVRYSRGDAPLRAFAPDPGGDRTWWAVPDDSEGGSCVAAGQVPARAREETPQAFGASACGDTSSRGYLLKADEVEREPREKGTPRTPFRTVVLGRVETRVRALAVTGPDGVARELAFARRGGAVLTVLPAGVPARELTVTATYADGAVERRALK